MSEAPFEGMVPRQSSLDVDWDLVDPAVEASLRMAIEMGFEGDGVTEWRQTSNEEWAGMAQQDMQDCQKSFDDAMLLSEAEDGGEVKLAGEEPEECEYAEGDAAYNEMPASGSVEYGDFDIDNDGEEWIVERVTGRRYPPGEEPMYRVKWKGYDQQTWERLWWLEGEGHGPLVRAYDASLIPERKKSIKLRKPRVKSSIYISLEKAANTFTKLMEGVLNGEFLRQAIIRLNQAALYVQTVTIVPIAMERLEQLRGTAQGLRLLFHGTRSSQAMTSIAIGGLKVPGTDGVRVVNGSAYGVGIYTAGHPSTSWPYSGHNRMFICAGTSNCSSHGFVHVYRRANKVTPIALVLFKNRAYAGGIGLSIQNHSPDVTVATRSFMEEYNYTTESH